MEIYRKIAPSILSADFGNLTEEIRKVENAGADWIHIDVMDGRFVPNITIGPPVIRSIRKATRLPFDVHLMIENPERYIESFAAAGSDWITVHVEAAPHLNRTVHLIKELGVKAGVAMNPATSLTAVEEILPEVDLLLIMTVNPGFGGQKFIESMIPKIEKARQKLSDLPRPPLLEIDGGVTIDNIERIYAAGAEIFVAGSSIFTSRNYQAAIQKMKKRIHPDRTAEMKAV